MPGLSRFVMTEVEMPGSAKSSSAIWQMADCEEMGPSVYSGRPTRVTIAASVPSIALSCLGRMVISVLVAPAGIVMLPGSAS